MKNPFSAIRDRISQLSGEVPALGSVDEQTNEEKDLCSYIKRKVDEVNSAANRIAHQGTWLTNVAYMLGFDSVYFDTTSRQFQNVNGNAASIGLRRSRVFENVILSAVQNRQARLCKSPPKFEVRPQDSTNEAKEEARLGLEVLLQLWDECDINVKRLFLTMWLQECGHAYMKVGFDDELGDELVDPMSGDVLGYEGQVTVEPCSAFEVYPDPLAQTLEQCQWVVQAKVRKLDYFRTRYPERGSLVHEESAWLMGIQYEQRIQAMNNTGINAASTVMQMQNAAIELSYYEKRSRKHPKGRFVVTANGILLADKELPVGEIPFAKFDDIPISGKYYSESYTTHARPLQDQYNRNLTRTSQWSNQLVAGKYMAARGHGLHEEALDDQSGEVVEYDFVPGCPPTMALAIPNIPAWVYTERNDLKKSIFEMYGLSDISRGQLPSAAIPAMGMQLLLEQDETRIGIEVEQHEHSYARMGQLMLMYASKYFKTERNLYKRGQDNEIMIESYEGEDLPKKPAVKVIRGSTIPTSLSMKRQEILNARSQGLLGNVQDPVVNEKILEMLEFGDTSGIWKDSALDAAQARKWIKMIEQGEEPPINQKDNNAYIVKQLNDYRKSEKGQDLPPQNQQLLEQVIDKIAQIGANLANPQLQQMQMHVDHGMTPDGKPLLEGLKDPMSGQPIGPIAQRANLNQNEPNQGAA